MIRADEDALVCDLAETYHIYNYRQLPARQVAVLRLVCEMMPELS